MLQRFHWKTRALPLVHGWLQGDHDCSKFITTIYFMFALISHTVPTQSVNKSYCCLFCFQDHWDKSVTTHSLELWQFLDPRPIEKLYIWLVFTVQTGWRTVFPFFKHLCRCVGACLALCAQHTQRLVVHVKDEEEEEAASAQTLWPKGEKQSPSHVGGKTSLCESCRAWGTVEADEDHTTGNRSWNGLPVDQKTERMVWWST